MEWRDIAATDEGYYERVRFLRDQILDAIERKGKNASPKAVESTLDDILSKSALETFETWPKQKPELEAVFIPFFLEYIVKFNMEPERQQNPSYRYQYALGTEGRCLRNPKKSNPFGFIKSEPIANPDLYTHGELVKNWRDIFVLDELIDEEENLRGKYAPRCKYENVAVPALILTTQHQLRIVDKKGNYVEGTNISFCRTKSGIGQLVKMAEYLTNLRANGEERGSIDDYLAALSREPEQYTDIGRWVKAMRLLRDVAEQTHSDLSNAIRLRGYTQDKADELRKILIRNPNIGGFVKSRSDLEFIAELLPQDKKGKFAEIWLPCDGNKICWQVYHDKGDYSYTELHGDEKTKHIMYKTVKERKMREGFTPWHWSIMKRLVPHFVSEYYSDPLIRDYNRYLSLAHFK